MNIRHHPDISTLMSFAAGSLPEALSAVVAAHIEMCPECAKELHRMEAIGATLFDRLEPVGLSKACVAPSDLAIAEAAPLRKVSAREDVEGDVPPSLARLIGPRLDDVPWRRLGLGVWHYPLPLSPGARGDLRLLKVAPAQVMPEHGHGGDELTLLLRGSYRDEIGTFARGDVADLSDDVEHSPISDAEVGCICLIAAEERARFKGIFARLVQPLTGL